MARAEFYQSGFLIRFDISNEVLTRKTIKLFMTLNFRVLFNVIFFKSILILPVTTFAFKDKILNLSRMKINIERAILYGLITSKNQVK